MMAVETETATRKPITIETSLRTDDIQRYMCNTLLFEE